MDTAESLQLGAAWRTLFGPGAAAPALRTLSSPLLRRAWRRRAWCTHPDRVPDAGAKRRATEQFIEAAQAYRLLEAFLARNAPSPDSRAARPASRPAPPPRSHGGEAPPGRRAAPVPALPRRRLRIGEFLYRTRVISFASLIAALLWQRRQRERFCEICRRWALLGAAEATLLLERRSPGETVGHAALRLGLLTQAQVGAVLAFQRSRQPPLGHYFLEQSLLTRRSLRSLLARHEAHNAACPRAHR